MDEPELFLDSDDEDTERMICGVFCEMCMIRTICQFRDIFRAAAF